ncbi:hypothetical protein GCM10009555_062550 [Acrocarpospora macrocephala]|uniref:Uncharacterized protein n=1 Tax=Acrocarpospora macrocephala TaxID=150177 RepID=A0A5M3WHN3_9ACTN|nr:hypothetical protein [Acrocarpospora macrocephala]GES07810.1 hypothetical protein Amac_014050 [Acrocarpospora macrocephala]
MGERGDLMAAMQARLKKVEPGEGPSSILEPGTLDDARRLSELAGDDDAAARQS